MNDFLKITSYRAPTSLYERSHDIRYCGWPTTKTFRFRRTGYDLWYLVTGLKVEGVNRWVIGTDGTGYGKDCDEFRLKRWT